MREDDNWSDSMNPNADYTCDPNIFRMIHWMDWLPMEDNLHDASESAF